MRILTPPSGTASDVLVIGAGVAGLSVAYHLARGGCAEVVVIEQEKHLGGHASGRNAGMIRQAVSDPVLARLARDGREALGRLGQKTWRGLGFRVIGSLLLAGGRDSSELHRISSVLKNVGVSSLNLLPPQAARLASVLEGADFGEALFCPSDAVLEIRPLLEGFLRQLEGFGVPVLLGHKLGEVEACGGGFRVRAGGRDFFARKIVNAAGAWAGVVAQKAGGARIPMVAYRRHLYLSRPFPALRRSWPFIWDLSHQFYFRPAGKGLLLSPCDRYPFRMVSGKRSLTAEKIDPRMRRDLERKLKKFSRHFGGLKIRRATAGLRTMTPDRRFVIGEDPKLKGFYWVAGLGGHGVTTCMSVGRLASDIILGRNRDVALARSLSPRRFLSGPRPKGTC